MRRSVRFGVFTAVATLVLVGVATPSSVSAASPPGPHRHASGLLVVTEADLRKDIPPRLRDAYAAYDLLAQSHPRDFGYVHVDKRGRLVLGVATRRGQAVLTSYRAGAVPARSGSATTAAAKQQVALAAAKAAARGASAAVVTEPSDSRDAVEALKHQVTELADDPALADADLWQSQVDAATEHVLIKVARLTDAAAARIVAEFGTERVEVMEAPNPESTDVVGRLHDNHPFYGGARIVGPVGECSDAFSWAITSKVSGMLTAGHCAPDGGDVVTPDEFMGSITSGSRENYSSTGTVYLPGESVYRGDMALIQVTSRKTSSPLAYRGAYDSTSNAYVDSMWSRRAQHGDKYCTGGSFSGEQCDWTVDEVGVDRKISGKWKRNIVTSGGRQGWCNRPGDSGGAVYTVSSNGKIVAKGILNSGGGGGSDYYGGFLDQCTNVFTDIWDAYLGFPGYLKTS
jgi:hypothetical protein